MAARAVELPSNVSQVGDAPEDCFAVVLDDVLSRPECDALVARAAPHFSVPRAVRSDDGSVVPLQFANATKYQLVVHDDPRTGDEIWRRIGPRIVSALAPFQIKALSGPPLGVCPRLRVLRYADADHRFDPHYDRIVAGDDGRRSLLTVLMYLNDGDGIDFDGGETCFLNASCTDNAPAAVTPKAGRVVVFEHGLFHCGRPLALPRGGGGDGDGCGAPTDCAVAPPTPRSNTKFVLRTDVLFGSQRWASTGRRPETALERLMRTAYNTAERDEDEDEDAAAATEEGTGGVAAGGAGESAVAATGSASAEPTALQEDEEGGADLFATVGYVDGSW
jgi:hypothetical protein